MEPLNPSKPRCDDAQRGSAMVEAEKAGVGATTLDAAEGAAAVGASQ
jgi:hypothetical protein